MGPSTSSDRPPASSRRRPSHPRLAQSAEGVERLRPPRRRRFLVWSVAPISSRQRRDPASRLMVVGREGRELLERLCQRMTMPHPFMPGWDIVGTWRSGQRRSRADCCGHLNSGADLGKRSGPAGLVESAVLSHGRSHRFDPCHAHQHKRFPDSLEWAACQKICQKRTGDGKGPLRSLLAPPRGCFRPPAGRAWRATAWTCAQRSPNGAISPSTCAFALVPRSWHDDALAFDRAQSRPVGFEDAGR
jgi:hypothetical protein